MLVGDSLTTNKQLVYIKSHTAWMNYDNLMLYEQREFEEARKELQTELEKGMSLDDIRKKITKGAIQTKASKQQGKKSHFTIERIQRKNRDPVQLLNKYAKVPAKATEKTSATPKALSTIELFARAKEEQSDGPIINRKIYKLGDKELLVRS